MMQNKAQVLVYLIGLFFAFNGTAQDFAEVHIIVKHQKSDKYIKDAKVTILPIDKTYFTDKNGLVKAGLPFAFYRFEVSTPMAEQLSKEVEITTDTTLFFTIEDDYMLLDEVAIEENQIDERIGNNIMSIEKMDAQQMDRIPVIGGEKDLLKAAAYLPGIQTGSEGSSDLLVRGGTPDQNMYLLDGARLYHSNHLYGFLSSFNPLMVSKLDVYKGGFPPRFGGKLSSIIDAKTSTPLYNDFEGEVTLGVISSSAKLNIPIISNRFNLMVGGRRSYYDAFVKLFTDSDNQELYNFHDLNVKLSGKINPKNEISFSVYMDRDLYNENDNHKETDKTAILKRKWNNKIYNLKWQGNTGVIDHNLNLYYSKFNTSITDEESTTNEYIMRSYSSFIKDYTVKYRSDMHINNSIQPYIGFEASWLEVLGAKLQYEDQDTSAFKSSLPEQSLKEYNIFGGLNFNIKNQWKADIGGRLSSVYSTSGSNHIFEPRASITYSPDTYKSLKWSYARMSQPIHMLTNPGLGMPIDIYLPASQTFIPESSHQIALGYIQNFDWLSEKWDFNTETYYKTLHNILEYRDGYSSHIFTSPLSQTNNKLEDIITTGRGKSYGAEFFLRKNTGNIKGFMSYTLSWTKHQFDDLNEGQYFPARHDVRHNLSISGTYKFAEQWRVNTSWQYKTGQAITVPLQTYPAPRFKFLNSHIRPYDPVLTVLYDQSERNQYRMKAFHVLNISIQKQFNWKKMDGTIEFGLYNAYNRKNPYYYYVENSIQSIERSSGVYNTQSALKSVSIFPIVPSLNVILEF